MGNVSYYGEKENNFYFTKSIGVMKLIDDIGLDEQISAIDFEQFENLTIDGKKATFGALLGDRYSFSSFPKYIQGLIVISSSAPLKQDESDLSFLLHDDIYNFFFNDNISGDLDGPTVRQFNTGIINIFNNLLNKLKDKESLTQTESKFYVEYSKIPAIRSLKVTGDLRIEIVKTTGESAFIQEQYSKLSEFFTLDRFKERVDKAIREFIDNGVDSGESWGLTSNEVKEENLITILYDDNPYVEWINLENDMSQRIDLTMRKLNSTASGIRLENIAGSNSTDMRTKVPYEQLKYRDKEKQITTIMYDSPTSYEEVFFYKRPREVIPFYPEDLKEHYDPTVDLYTFGNFFKNNRTGPEHVVAGYYIKFINDLVETVEATPEDKELPETIGTYEKYIVEEAYIAIIPKLFAFQENLIRFNLAKIVSAQSEEQLQNVEDSLDQARQNADDNLSGLAVDSDDLIVDEEDIEARTQLYKQCCLLLNMKDLKADYDQILKSSKNKIGSIHSTYSHDNRLYMIQDSIDPLAIKNKLITPTGKLVKPFMNITNDILSALRPRLRFYKIYKDKDGKTYSFEFPFPSFTDPNRVVNFDGKSIDRGDGVGIKSFNFSFDGETPATSQKFINADLTLFFQSFHDFVKERTVNNGKIDNEGNTEDETFRYVDMFVNTKFCPKDKNSLSPLHYDPEFYRLRVDVGWEPRGDKEFRSILEKRGFSTSQLQIALERLNKSFYLNLIDHEINIADNGTVTISANYIAFIEGFLSNQNALISRETQKAQQQAIDSYNEAGKKCKRTNEAMKELTATINALRVASRDSIHQSLIEKLLKNNCLFYTHAESATRKDFTKKRFFSSKPRLKSSARVVSESRKFVPSPSASGKKIKIQKWEHILNSYVRDPQKDDNERICFFFVADMVYFLLDSLYKEGEEEREEQIKIILSSFSIDNPFDDNDDDETLVNIGQIPVEVEVFTKWYKEEIIDKDLEFISFMDFIKRFANYLITDIYTELCVNNQQHKRLSFMTAPITSVKVDEIGAMERMMTIEKVPVIDLNVFYTDGSYLPLPTSVESGENTRPSDFIQYLLIYPHHRPKFNTGKGDPREDEKKGIHHLYIGQDRGLLKTVSFSKSDIQFQREARMLSQGRNSLLQLSSLYRSTITMVGNTIFYPGMLLYLNPFGFGGMEFGLPNDGPGSVNNPNLSNIMGIGGYQRVLRVNSSIDESGKFETTVECYFEHSGEEPRTSIRTEGDEQQRLPNICSDDASVDNDKNYCDIAKRATKKGQAAIRSLTQTGNISSKFLKGDK
tara:strand:+ start:3174 stop:7037 length:3864 start_codon:yes stop_codon:yes gene_type:complete